MTWWRDFADRMLLDAPLGRRTWFRLGGCARYLFQPTSAAELAEAVLRARHADLPVKVLGQGANVLISDDGFDGVVIRLDHDAFRRISRNGGDLHVGAGVDLMNLARRCSAEGLSGLEYLAGIPATVGGAVRMNAGGRLGEFGDVVRSVQVLSAEGKIEERPREAVGFQYRHTDLDDCVVLSATIDLHPEDPEKVRKRFNDFFEQKLRDQPIADKSAGCIFKNPEGRSAGRIIDQAGLKGARCGRARVSEQHANFIVAERGATASDVLHLIDLVRDRVWSDFDIELETEIDVWRPVRAGAPAS